MIDTSALHAAAVGTSGAHMNTEERLRQGHVMSEGSGKGMSDIMRDLFFYLRNNHVLLSAFLAHKDHPYPPERRRLVLVNSIGFAFFLATISSLGICGGSCSRRAERHGWVHIAPILTPIATFLRDWPTTISVVLQLVWDVPGGSLGICHCAQVGPCRRSCGRGMLMCYFCHMLGMIYAALGAGLLLLFSLFMGLVAVQDVLLLMLTTKGLAFLFGLPVSCGIFLLLWRHERRERPDERPPSEPSDLL